MQKAMFTFGTYHLKRVWKTKFKFIQLFVYTIFVRKIKWAIALYRVGHLTWCLSDKWYVPKNRGITWASYSLINLQKNSANEWDSLEWNKLELKKTKIHSMNLLRSSLLWKSRTLDRNWVFSFIFLFK
jgi:hypothetical protein